MEYWITSSLNYSSVRTVAYTPPVGPVHKAAEEGDLLELRRIILNDKTQKDSKNERGRTHQLI